MSHTIPKFDIEIDNLDESTLKYALNNTNEGQKEQYLEELKHLIAERGECNQYTFEDNFLLRFLRARNFVVRHAHRLLVNYYKFKRNNIEYYGNLRIEGIKESKIINVQPTCDASNRRIFIYKLGNWNPEKLSFNEVVQHTILGLELFMMEPRTQILGGICIVDLEGIKKRQLRFITLKFITQMLDILLWSFPIRIHAVHIVNDTEATDFDFSIVKLFMNNEAKRRILSHGSNRQSLYQQISPIYLPKCYGGSQAELDYGLWLTDLIQNNHNILEELRKTNYAFVK